MTRRGNGEGSIYKNTDGRWVAAVDLGRDELGRRRRRRFYGASRRDVKDLLTIALHAHSENNLRGGRSETLGAYLVRWAASTPVRDSTRDHYQRNMARNVIPTLGRVELTKVTGGHVDALLRAKLEQGLSPRSVHHVRAILRNALGRAVKLGLIPRNPVELTDAPRVPAYEARFLSVAEARAFLEAARGDRLEALYSVALALGLRQGEALALAWDAVDLEARTVRVSRTVQRLPGRGLVFSEPKTSGSARTLVMPATVMLALRRHRAAQLEERLAGGGRWQDRGLVFTTYEGRPLSASHVVNGSFRRVCTAAGIPFATRAGRGLRFHDLRHSAATLLLAQGVPQRVVMEQLGHSTLAMTQRYTHVLPSLMGDAAAAMDRALGS